MSYNKVSGAFVFLSGNYVAFESVCLKLLSFAMLFLDFILSATFSKSCNRSVFLSTLVDFLLYNNYSYCSFPISYIDVH